jgi:DNA repair protein RecO (recombination protein O)
LPISQTRSRLQTTKINASQLAILQQLAAPEIPISEIFGHHPHWISVERLLRQYAQYHLDCFIRSASLIDTYVESPVN